jgi:tetratricopeptide (TPR) repeat protein
MDKQQINSSGRYLEQLSDYSQARKAVPLVTSRALVKILSRHRKWLKFGPTVLALQVLHFALFPGLSFANQVGNSDSTVISQATVKKERRVALVIGNSNYAEKRLNNPLNDANDMAQALRNLGFEVSLKTDLNNRQMQEEIGKFNQELRPGGVGLFYYAGHGLQLNGENYLVPIGAKLNQENDVVYDTVPLGKVLGAMNAVKKSVNIVMIDACRTNPYSRGWRSTDLRGLSTISVSARGTFISFATGPGEVAADGNETDRNSPYTASVLKHITDPGLPIGTMFQQVRESVMKKTGEKQMPWDSSSLLGNFIFNSGDASYASSTSLASNQQVLPAISSSPQPITPPALAKNDPLSLASGSSVLPSKITAKQLVDYAYYKQRWISRKKDDLNGTISDLTELIRIEKETGKNDVIHFSYALRAKLYFDLGNMNASILDLSEAIKNREAMKFRQDPDNYYERGLAHEVLGNKKDAVADFNSAISLHGKRIKDPIDPNDELNSYIYRGDIYLHLGDKQNAIANFKKVMEIQRGRGLIDSIGYRMAERRLSSISTN